MAAYDKGRTLQIGGGLLFFEGKQPDGSYGEKTYFGPTESITIAVANEWIEHKSTEGCVQLIDKKISIGKTADISIGSTTINPTSLARAFQGTIMLDTQAEQTALPVVTAGVTLGSVTDLGYRGVTDVVVQDDTDTTTYVDGVDYELVPKAGYLIPLVGGAIADDDILHVAVTAPAFDGVIVSAMKIDQLEGRLTLVTNSNTSNDYEYVFKNVNITQDGDFALKGGDSFAEISYAGSITIDSETPASSLSQFFDIYTLPSGSCDSATVQ